MQRARGARVERRPGNELGVVVTVMTTLVMPALNAAIGRGMSRSKPGA